LQHQQASAHAPVYLPRHWPLVVFLQGPPLPHWSRGRQHCAPQQLVSQQGLGPQQVGQHGPAAAAGSARNVDSEIMPVAEATPP